MRDNSEQKEIGLKIAAEPRNQKNPKFRQPHAWMIN